MDFWLDLQVTFYLLMTPVLILQMLLFVAAGISLAAIEAAFKYFKERR